MRAVKNSIISNKPSTCRSVIIVSWPKECEREQHTLVDGVDVSQIFLLYAVSVVVSIDVLRQPPVVSGVYPCVRLLTNLHIGRAVGPTSVSGYVRRVHLNVIVALQSSVGVIHALDRARQEVERGGIFVWGDWGRLQLSAPRVGKSDGTVRWGRGIRDGFTE